MTLQKNNSDKCAEAAELAAIQRANVLTIEGLTDLANDLIIQNAAIRNLLDKTEKQRDELLRALELADDDIQYYGNSDFNKTLIEIRAAIAKARGE